MNGLRFSAVRKTGKLNSLSYLAPPFAAQVHASDQRVLEEVRKPELYAGNLFRLLQLLPDTQNAPLHSGNGSRIEQARLGLKATDRHRELASEAAIIR